MLSLDHRIPLIASLALCLLTAPTAAANWTDSVFPIKEHQFGTVAVASKTEFRFPVVNTLDRELHIRTVRASCGCTTPIVEREYIPPGETGSILARFNTDTFRGKRGATLTVVIDKPFYAEARLRVDGYIRRDMVFQPGAIEFGQVDVGTAATSEATVRYAGRSDWKILDLQCELPWVQADFRQLDRGQGRVEYELAVSLREDAPAGSFQDQIVVVTNDRRMPRVPLRISGEIESAVTIAPQLISLGSLKPGETVSQRLVVRGREPFTIESIDCEGWNVEFEPSSEPKKLHILATRFTPVDAAGAEKAQVVIKTGGKQELGKAQALLTAVIREQ